MELQSIIEQRRKSVALLATRTKNIERATLIAILTSMLTAGELEQLASHINKENSK